MRFGVPTRCGRFARVELFVWALMRCSRPTAALTAQQRALHARPVIQTTPADFDKGQNPVRFPIGEGATAHGQPCQKLFFVNEASFVCRGLVLIGAVAIFSHARADRRRDAQKIFPFTIHATETLCEVETGWVCHTCRISIMGDTLPKSKVSSQSVQSHPRSWQIGSHLIGDRLAFARLQPTGFGWGKPYSSSKRGFCVRETVAVNPQTVRPNGRADVRSHGLSVTSPQPGVSASSP